MSQYNDDFSLTQIEADTPLFTHATAAYSEGNGLVP